MTNINTFNARKAGQKIRNLRQDAGMSAKQFAETIGSTEASICAYERGSRIPADRIKVLIANYFEMSVQEIFFTATRGR